MIIVYGGSDGATSTSTVIGYSSSDGSVQLSSMSVARSLLGYAPDRNGNPYAFGGLDDNGQPLSSVERYDQDSGTWSAIASLPTARCNFPAVFNRTNYIYTFGGRTNAASGTETATVLCYSVSANSWTAMAPMPIAVASWRGGVGSRQDLCNRRHFRRVTICMVRFDPASNSWAVSTLCPSLAPAMGLTAGPAGCNAAWMSMATMS
jgi:hypothetical protein